MAGERIDGETSLAYAYFQIFRDMPPEERNLRVLCERQVNRKKRTLGVIGRWSSQHNWQSRVAAWDRDHQLAELVRIKKEKAQQTREILQSDMALCRSAQTYAMKVMRILHETIDEGREIRGEDLSAFRQLMMGYQAARGNLIELLGIKDDETKRLEDRIDQHLQTEAVHRESASPF